MSVFRKCVLSPAVALVEEHIDLSAFINRVELNQSKDPKQPNAWSDSSEMNVKAVNVVLFEQLDDLQMHLEHLDERHGESTNQGNIYRLIYKPHHFIFI